MKQRDDELMYLTAVDVMLKLVFYIKKMLYLLIIILLLTMLCFTAK
jgi:hypothetical protein